MATPAGLLSSRALSRSRALPPKPCHQSPIRTTTCHATPQSELYRSRTATRIPRPLSPRSQSAQRRRGPSGTDCRRGRADEQWSQLRSCSAPQVNTFSALPGWRGSAPAPARIVSFGWRPSLRRNTRAGSAPRRGSKSSLAAVESETVEGVRAENRAVMEAQRQEQIELNEFDRPLAEYMTLPASQYSVLDAERIERVDDSTFKCYVHRLSLFNIEVCPVLLVRVDERPDGCCIRLLGCSLDGSPIVTDQNQRFSASMVNYVTWAVNPNQAAGAGSCLLRSDTSIKVTLEVPTPFRIIPKNALESTGSQVLMQLLRVALPRFLTQLKRDYEAWASGDTSRKPLGTGEI